MACQVPSADSSEGFETWPQLEVCGWFEGVLGYEVRSWLMSFINCLIADVILGDILMFTR